ncbi:MAG: outer membrane protein SusC, starch binding [Bacteroidetes bacterium]|nr:outer membrane protein SusC, starch binding [Bacteroidota bacterium]
MKQTISCLRVPGILFLLLLFSISAFGQAITVKGTVKDATNATLPGVNVRIQGSSSGTITDVDGKYSIQVPANAKLEFSFVGYSSQILAVNGKSVINITLAEDTKALSEVVVVGYGTQRREAVTGSVASMNGDKLRDVPAANIARALQGRVAGVEMSQTSTKPGSSMQIRIRGTRSLNATNDPLVVLDGIPFAGSIGDIDPNNIKSIDILKDASATAIYGSRGANGVILVTSISGQKGQTAHVTYSGYYGIKKVFAKYPMMNGSEFAALRKAANIVSNTLDESNDVSTDWQSLLYQTGTVTNHDLGISGGSEKGNYNFGISYYKDQSVIPLQNYSRYSLRNSLDQLIGKLFHFGFNTNTSYQVTNGNNLGPGTALAASPLASPYNTDGTPKSTYLKATSGAEWIYTKQTLKALGDNYIDQTRAFSSYNSAFAEINIPGVEGLKYRANIGLNYRQSNYGNFTGQGVFSGTPSTVSSANISNEHKINWAIENLLSYDRTFAKVHRLNAVAMYSSEQTTYWYSSASAQDIPAQAFQFYNLGYGQQNVTINPKYQNYWQRGLMSYMGRVMYSYNDRYMLSATVRSDASSVLAAGHQWHTYPAVSAGWNINEESFMKSLTAIDKLKIFAGYGETSNQSVDPYSTLGLLTTNPYNYGTTYSTGVYLSKIPNPKLGWEFSKTWNFGVDFSLLKNRLSGKVEYYIMNTDNVLLNVNMPASTGIGSYTANIGATQNKGLEFSLNGVILDNLNGWTWSAGINIYTNKNKLVSLASGATKDESNWWFVGHSINSIYDYKKIGIWQTTDKYQSILEPGTAAGLIKVLYTGTYNADGTPTRAIGADDRQIIDTDPDFAGGFNTNVSYKGFDLSLVGVFKSGGILNSTLYGSGSYLNNLNARSNNNVKVDYWTSTNTGAKYPKPGGAGGDNPKYGSTLGYFSASYLKVRTITLGYNFNQKWLKSAGIDKLRVYCTVENPFVLFSPYKNETGMDPETNSMGNENAAVPLSDNLKRMLTLGTSTPTTRNYLIGLSVTF